jgi:hypothetical protein
MGGHQSAETLASGSMSDLANGFCEISETPGLIRGQPSRVRPDWFAPAPRIWIDDWNEGAVYLPDGMTTSLGHEH